MKKMLSLLALAALLYSCGKDSAASYGKKFCACVEKHQGQNKECADIMSEAKKKFPDGKDEFMEVAKPCLDKH